MRTAITIAAVLACAATARAGGDQGKPAAGSASAGAAAVVAPMPPKQPPAPMPVMTPAKEVTDAAKVMVGSYKCKGVDFNPDGSSRPSLSTMKISTDMDGFWILVDMQEQKTKDNTAPFKAKMYRTFDPQTKKWIDTIVAAAPGGPMTMTTTDAMGGPVTWAGSFTMMGQTFAEKSHEEPDAKTKSVHLWGEVSMDGGKTFNKEYDITCKK